MIHIEVTLRMIIKNETTLCTINKQLSKYIFIVNYSCRYIDSEKVSEPITKVPLMYSG